MSGDTWFFRPFRPSLTHRAPILPFVVDIMASLMAPKSTFEAPSMVFRHTLPVKPSVTTTSYCAPSTSRPSQFPAKLVRRLAMSS